MLLYSKTQTVKEEVTSDMAWHEIEEKLSCTKLRHRPGIQITVINRVIVVF